MKIREISICWALCGLLSVTSCSTLRKSSSTAFPIESSVQQYPTVVDLEVKAGKINKQVEWGFVPFNLGQPSLENRKQNLLADAIQEQEADILLEPQIVYTKIPFGKRTLTVTGYPATFKNFRKATPEDLEALKAVSPLAGKSVYQVASEPWYKRLFGSLFLKK